MTRQPRLAALFALLPILATGCYSEGLDIHDFFGHVVIPREAATHTFVDPNTGAENTVTDVALIGPVYLGLYPSVDTTLEDYPIPVKGPDGASHPYSGTTVGDMRYACLEFFTCKMISGRFASYDDILTWYADVVGDPVVDAEGQEITVGQTIQQTCFDLLRVTSDEEIRVLAGDRDGNGTIDAADLDFVEDENGDFVGQFEIPQADFYFNEQTGRGMKLWAFMDSPSYFVQTSPDGLTKRNVQAPFGTCVSSFGYNENTYDRDYQAGLQNPYTLNFPSRYINEGDRVSCKSFEYTDPGLEAELVLDFTVGTDSTFDSGSDCQ